MISKEAVNEQLKRIGFNFRFWGRAEVNELGRILLDDEIIAECANGEYANGFALLVATNHRILLVDKKPMLYLTVEDLRFDMITEFNFSHRMMNATIRFYTANKTLEFRSWNQPRLRRLLEYSQQRVLEMRQQQHMAQQFQAAAAAQYVQIHAANHYQFMSQPQSQGSQGDQSALPQTTQSSVQDQSHNQPHNNQGDQLQSQSQSQSQTMYQPQQLQPAQAVYPLQSQSQSQPENRPAGQHHGVTGVVDIVSRLSAKRTALGTYTRSKLPSFRRHQDQQDARSSDGVAQSGEVYPKGYTTGRPVTDYGLPYEY